MPRGDVRLGDARPDRYSAPDVHDSVRARYEHVDFVVRAKPAFKGGDQSEGAEPIPESIAANVRKVPGVAYASGGVEGFAEMVAPDGKVISSGRAPTLGVSFDPNRQLSSLHLAEGVAPTTPHDVAIDEGTAQKYQLSRR